MLSPETVELLQKGGMLVGSWLVIAWLLWDRKRFLVSLADKDTIIKAKDALIASKDEKLAALSERTITAIVEFRGLLQSVVDIFNSSRKR